MLPLATAAGFVPGVAPVCLLLLAACIAAAAYDAIGGIGRVRAIRGRLPELLRLTKDVAAAVPVTIENGSGSALIVRLAVTASEAVNFEEPVKEAIFEPGTSAIEWSCTPHARGDHRIEALHIETASPLG